MEIQQTILKPSKKDNSLIAYAEDGKVIIFNNLQNFLGVKPGDCVSYSQVQDLPRCLIAHIEGVIRADEIKPEPKPPAVKKEKQLDALTLNLNLIKSGRRTLGFLIPTKLFDVLEKYHHRTFKVTFEPLKEEAN